MIAFLLLFVALGQLYRDMVKQPETRALLIAAAVLLLGGAVFYARVEHWSALDAVYFCVVTLGTVGYGDITPRTDLGKLFTIFYIIFGLGIVGGFFATAGRLFHPRRLLERETSHLERTLRDDSPPETERIDPK